MEKSSGLYWLVYYFYEARILFGYYRFGDSLPPIPYICDTFHLGRATVRTALSALEKAGYVRTGARRTAQVCYKADSAQLEKNAAIYFASRKVGLQEFNSVGQLLLVPLWKAGTRGWDETQWELCRRHFSSALPGGTPPSVELYLMALKGLNNRLALNFYWEAMRYFAIPSLLDREKVKHPIDEETILKGLNSGNAAAYLSGEMNDIYLQLEEELFAFIDRSGAKYDLESTEQIPFQWNIYRQRPQLRYSLSSLLIREIVHGKYPIGSYLPPLPELMHQYGVSLTTVRRTLSLLEEMGVTKSFQGKGTQVRMERIRIDIARSEIQEGLRLCRESLQLLALTIRGVSLNTLEHASEEKRVELADHLYHSLDCGQSYYCFEIMLSFIKRECLLDMVRECYGRLADLVAWGYPFIRLLLPDTGLKDAYSACVKRMERHLRRGDLDAFSCEWAALMEQEERKYAAYVQRDSAPEAVFTK